MSESGHNKDIDTHEALLSFQLRGRLALINFKLIWPAMVKLKWRHSGSEYITPYGENLGSSKNAMETLDACVLSCLGLRDADANVHIIGDDDDTSAHLENHKKLRKDLLTAVFYRCKKSSTPLPCFFFDREDDEEESESQENRTDGKKKSASSETRNVSVKYNTRSMTHSLTANEKGTGEYLDNKTRKPSKKDRDANYARISRDDIMDGDNDDEANSSKKKLKWPSPSDCVLRNKGEEKGGDELKDQKDWRKQFLEKHFAEWKFLLSSNHSLLLFGFGSKQALLNDFAKQLRRHGDVLTLNGFDPNVSIDQILDIFVQLFLNGVEPSTSMQLVDYQNDNLHEIDVVHSSPSLLSNAMKRAKSIGQALGARQTKPIYLVIHNIDGMGLMDDDVQKALVLLLVHSILSVNVGVDGTDNGRVIRLVASIDQVDSPISLWDVETLSNFSWIWKSVDTYAPYFDEVKKSIKDETRKIKMKQMQSSNFVFMQKVIKSLAPKHSEILKVLADMQISAGGDVSYKDWKSRCFDKMIVKGEGEMRSILNELRDHGMIRLNHDHKKEYICIPTSIEKVKDILQLL